jgi:hypothetical protein
MLLTLVIVALVLGALAVTLHLLPKQKDPTIAKAQADVDSLWDVVVSHFEKKASAPTSVAALSVNHTVTVGGNTPTPDPVVAPAPVIPTANGVPVPAGMDLGTFTQLVAAVSSAGVMLSAPHMDASLIGSSQAWWNSLGDFYREALLHEATGPVLEAFRTLSVAAGAPAPLSVSATQWAAATQAAGGK